MSWKTCIEQLIGSIPFPTLVFDDSNKVILSNAIESQVVNWTLLPLVKPQGCFRGWNSKSVL